MVASTDAHHAAAFEPLLNPGNELYANVSVIREAILPLNFMRRTRLSFGQGPLRAFEIETPPSDDSVIWAHFKLKGDIKEWFSHPTYDFTCECTSLSSAPAAGVHVVLEAYYYAYPSTPQLSRTRRVTHPVKDIRTGVIQTPNPVPPVTKVFVINAAECAQF